tara:strand:+ start:1022 stop:1324 length:303 start_codon:yes stop_codon:yes gene_type:complete
MTPKFDQLVSELKKTPGINYAREKGAEFTAMPITGQLAHGATGGKGRQFRALTRDADVQMLALAKNEVDHLKKKADAGKKNLDNDKKTLKDLKKPVKTQV